MPSKAVKNAKRGSIIAAQGWEHPDHTIWEAPFLNEREIAVGRSIQKIFNAIATLSPVVNVPAGARVGVGGILMAHLVVEQNAFNGLLRSTKTLLSVIDAVVKGSTGRTCVLPLTALWQHVLELEAGRVPLPLLALSWPCPSIDTWIQVCFSKQLHCTSSKCWIPCAAMADHHCLSLDYQVVTNSVFHFIKKEN